MPILEPQVAAELTAALEARRLRGRLPAEAEYKAQLARFREKFGPAVLGSLHGKDLLHYMLRRGSNESLYYWLEYKHDAEFSARALFGSIKGGSAFKFGLFQRDTGQWVTGGRGEEELTPVRAAELCEKQRDQLLKCVALLDDLPERADDDAYDRLQTGIKKAASDVYKLAWAHKYLSLLFPEKLDDLHNHDWQRYHLIKLLQLPPERKGLYASAGRYVAIAAELGWPLLYLTAACNERHGKPVKYWRVGTRIGGRLPGNHLIWQAMLRGEFAAIGWADVGDLSELRDKKDARKVLREELAKTYYPDDPRTASRKAGEVLQFLTKIKEHHVIVAADGERVKGIGVVEGDYYFDESDPADAPNRLPVRWVPFDDWKLPTFEGKQTTVYRIGKDERNLVAIERQLLNLPTESKSERAVRKQAHKLDVKGEFDAENEADGRERVEKSIAVRRGQPRFRADLLAAYDGKCAITGCDAEPALEAAHIRPYMGAHSHHLTNGLLLRADLHTLFDLGQLRIDPETRRVTLSECLHGTQYADLEGVRLREPMFPSARPSQKALRKHFGKA